MLDWGIDLSLPITQQKMADKDVYFVADSTLAACFESSIDENFIKELAKHQPPLERVVFREHGFLSDDMKINACQIFKQLSPATKIKFI